jgi:hypothetical protein
MTKQDGIDLIRVSNLYVACGIARTVQGDQGGSAAAGLQGARAAYLAAITFRGAWGFATLSGNDDDSLKDAARQAMRNAIHLAEDVVRRHASNSKEAANLAYSWRSELSKWWSAQ